MISRVKLGKIALGGLIASTLIGVTPVLAETSSVTPTSSVVIEETPGAQEQVDVFKMFDDTTFSYGEKENTSDILSAERSFAPAAVPTQYTSKFTRGSFLAWLDIIVDWTVAGDGSQITSSSGHQDSGSIWPNSVETKGITKQSSSAASYHIYLSQATLTAQVQTPWGDAELASKDYSDYVRVTKEGTASTY